MWQALYGPTFMLSATPTFLQVLVCMMVFIRYITMLGLVAFLQVAHSVNLLLYSAEASVQSDKGSGAGWRFHPLQTVQESHPKNIR